MSFAASPPMRRSNGTCRSFWNQPGPSPVIAATRPLLLWSRHSRRNLDGVVRRLRLILEPDRDVRPPGAAADQGDLTRCVLIQADNLGSGDRRTVDIGLRPQEQRLADEQLDRAGFGDLLQRRARGMGP